MFSTDTSPYTCITHTHTHTQVHYMQPEFSKPPDTTGGKAPDTSGKVPEPEAPVVYSDIQTATKTE